MKKLESQAQFQDACRCMSSWLLILVGMPRAILEDGTRMVQLVGMPMAAQHQFVSWATKHHPVAIMAARDDDGMLRSTSEHLYHEWLVSLFVVEKGEVS